MAHVGVHLVGEVQWRCTNGQVVDLSPRRHHVDAIAEKFRIELVEEFITVPAIVLPLQQLAKPVGFGLQIRVRFRRPAFVAPVSGNAEFGMGVHLMGADLHLQGVSRRANDGRVQRLVTVRLGLGDVVVEFLRHVQPQAMHDAQSRIAVAHLIHQDAHGAQVVHLVEAQLLVTHFSPDAVDVLRASADLGSDARVGQLLRQLGDDLFDEALAIGAPRLQLFGECLIGFGLELAQGQIFQLPLEVADAEPACQRRVHVEARARHVPALLGTQIADLAHAHQVLGQLDEHHAHVFDHGQEQILDPLQLFLVFARRCRCMPVFVDGVHLRQAIHQARNFAAVVLFNGVHGGCGPLLPGVQDGRGHALVVQVQLAQLRGDGTRMGARGVVGGVQGLLDDGGLRRRKVAQVGLAFAGMEIGMSCDHGTILTVTGVSGVTGHHLAIAGTGPINDTRGTRR